MQIHVVYIIIYINHSHHSIEANQSCLSLVIIETTPKVVSFHLLCFLIVDIHAPCIFLSAV